MRAADYLKDSALADTRWSIAVRDLDGGTLLEVGSRRQLRTASVAKVFLLLEVAARINSGELDAAEHVSTASVEPVGDSGLWQHLRERSLAVADAAALVGAVSDNLATNVLLRRVGLAAVQRRADSLAAHGSTLHDRVRDVRTRHDPATLSTGTAADWVHIVAGLERGFAAGDPVNTQVVEWLSHSVDHSMVLSGLTIDPLAPSSDPFRRITFNKTGTDLGVRADVGVVRGPERTIGYAVMCNWDVTRRRDLIHHVVGTMRDIGASIGQAALRATGEAL